MMFSFPPSHGVFGSSFSMLLYASLCFSMLFYAFLCFSILFCAFLFFSVLFCASLCFPRSVSFSLLLSLHLEGEGAIVERRRFHITFLLPFFPESPAFLQLS